MTRLAFLFLLLFAVSVHAATFDYQVDIEGVGNREKNLRSQLDIEAWHDSPEMNLEQLQRLHAQTPARLKELLATEGYFNAVVSPSLTQNGASWIARYRIALGEPARVRALTIEFDGEIEAPEEAERRQRLTNSWPLPVGQVFDQTLWRSGKNLLLEDLSAERYPFASLKESAASVSDDGRAVDIKLRLNSGRHIRFGELQISGLSAYSERIVRNLNRIRPGSDYKRSDLLEYQQRLIESGYFSGVLVEPTRPTEADRHVSNIAVQVVELKQQRLRLGVGYSTDTRARVSIDYEHRDILDKGWRWNNLIRAEQKAQSLTTTLTFPPSSGGYRDSVGYNFEHDYSNDDLIDDLYNNRIFARRYWGDSRYERTFSLELLHEILYKNIYVPIKNPDGTTQTDEDGNPVSTFSHTEASDTTTIGASYNLIKRDVDDFVFPTRGKILDLQSMIGSKIDTNTEPYVRLYGRWNYYKPLGKNWNFLGRFEVGGIMQRHRDLDDVPATYQFLGGGDNSVRGYAYESLGEVVGENLDRSKRIERASTQVIASTEIQYWFQPKWGVATFIDAGSIDDEVFDGPVYIGYGLGLRWRSPVGPLNLDYGYGPHATDKDHHQIHFSIGVAF